ncbi:MAG: AMP-dependent synthetase [Bacteroidetes bacterium]|nr:MAG: AMP-dependent synthetase [Bacteroidota bacterium]
MSQPVLPLQNFLHWENTAPNDVFLRQPIAGHWHSFTWAQAGQQCRSMAAALQGMGLQPGTHVALLSKNCAHWLMADVAIMMAGCVSIPIYPTLSSAGIKPILEHSGAQAIICGKLDDYAEQQLGFPPHMPVIGIDAYGTRGQQQWEALVQQHAPLAQVHPWQPADCMSIIYTSGTTGLPKGVMHSCQAFAASTEALINGMGLGRRPQLFSFLPLTHIAERVGIQMVGICNGGTIAFSESLTSFAADLESVQPTFFFAVPRLWAKFQEGVLLKMPQKKLDLLLRVPIVNGIIRKKITHKLGLSRATHIFSGAAPLSPAIIAWFQKLGILIIQGYGMTEDCIYGHFEYPGNRCLGSVGKPLPGLKTKFTAVGELCVKSNGLMMGYYKDPVLTAASFDGDGYLLTGDLAAYNHEGYLFITGRSKDQFKTDKGKYVAPSPIEMALAANNLVEQVCVVGMGIPQPLALVTLALTSSQLTQAEIVASLSATLVQVNMHLEAHEKVEKIVVMQESWTIANGLITPTMKIKRNEVEKIHQQFYPSWFSRQGMVVWEG